MEIGRIVVATAAGQAVLLLYYELVVAGPQRRRMRELGCEPVPYDRQWFPLFGLDFLAARSRHVKSHTWLEYSKQHFLSRGLKTVQLNILNHSVIYTIDPVNLQAIHVSKFKAWGIPPSRRQRVVPLIGDGVFTKDGKGWQHSRKLLRPSFERSQLTDLAFFEEYTQLLLKKIPRDGAMVDLQKLFYRFTMDTASAFLLSASLTQNAALEDEFGAAFDRCLSKVGGAGSFMSFGPSGDAQYERDRRLVHSTIDQHVQQALDEPEGESPTSRRVFLSHLISETRDKEQLRAELLNNLMAGRDSSASMLTNTWFELARHPSVWKRTQAEIQAAFGGQIPRQQSELQVLPYLRAVFDESLRMYPQIAENGRIALEDTVLPAGGGVDGKAPVFVPKGRVAMWGNYVLQRDPDVFGPDADQFIPERWLQEDGRAPLKPGFAYLSFGAGPRQCIGQQFALTQAMYLTVRMMQTFSRIESSSSSPWRERLSLVLSSDGGCPVVLS